jgi:hypothetical protein
MERLARGKPTVGAIISLGVPPELDLAMAG